MLQLNAENLQKLKASLATMPEKEKRRVAELLKTYQTQITQAKGKDSFLDFIQHVYPGYKVGPHHRKLGRIFEEIAEGKKKRVIVNIAPRHGKSEMISYLAPAWFLGKFPQKKVIMASHTADLAVNFGRRVRNLVGSENYRDIFPQVELQADSKSASRWGTNFNGEYFAIGVGGALAGRGADLFIIDDPHSEQEAKQGRPEVFEQAWEWFQSGPVQRLMPGGAIIVVMCMTGDTGVLRPDGSETPLKDIRPGDEIATYEEGKITVSHVLNHQSNGVDQVFTVQTRSGKILRANERHPFLVDFAGERRWVRLKDLKPGMLLVATKAATVPLDHKPNPDFALHAKPVSPIAKNAPTPPSTHPDIMGNGGALNAWWRGVKRERRPKVFAEATTQNSIGLMGVADKAQKQDANIGSSHVTELRKSSTSAWLRSAATAVISAVNHLLTKILGHTGTASSASTTATTQEKSGDFFATTATLLSDTEKLLTSSTGRLSTYDVVLDEIVSINPAGEEEVFDVEIERTENFIANGVVSHNTRWSKSDLTGKIVDHMTREDGADQWEVVEFPAILNDKPLWPEFWDIDELLAKKASMDVRYWQAQYMQQPTSEEGALIKREWWQVWEKDDPPQCEYIIMSLDAAQEKTNRSDYNALLTWGIFFNEETKTRNIILLNSIKQRLEFPDLKAMVLEEYKEWNPDTFIVEKKSNGAALYQEMRRMGIPVGEFTPGKGQDKISRVNAVTDLFSSGIVWIPDRRWAWEVAEECNDFPSGTHDDLVDATTLALLRFRQGGFIRLPNDEPEPTKWFKSHKRNGYY
jgi:predicted phage terminase large subunit-like protein